MLAEDDTKNDKINSIGWGSPISSDVSSMNADSDEDFAFVAKKENKPAKLNSELDFLDEDQEDDKIFIQPTNQTSNIKIENSFSENLTVKSEPVLKEENSISEKSRVNDLFDVDSKQNERINHFDNLDSQDLGKIQSNKSLDEFTSIFNDSEDGDDLFPINKSGNFIVSQVNNEVNVKNVERVNLDNNNEKRADIVKNKYGNDFTNSLLKDDSTDMSNFNCFSESCAEVEDNKIGFNLETSNSFLNLENNTSQSMDYNTRIINNLNLSNEKDFASTDINYKNQGTNKQNRESFLNPSSDMKFNNLNKELQTDILPFKNQMMRQSESNFILQKQKEAKTDFFKFKPIVKSLKSSKVLTFTKTVQKRYVNGFLNDVDVNVFTFRCIFVPNTKEVVIKSKVINDLISCKLSKSISLEEVEKRIIKGILGIQPSILFQDDLLVKIETGFLNNFLLSSKPMLNNPSDVYNLIFKKAVENEALNNDFKMELIKSKLGLDYDFSNVHLDSTQIMNVLKLNDDKLNKAFLNSQELFIEFFIVFYKLGYIKVENYLSRISNNIYYLHIFDRIKKNEDIASLLNYKENKESWSFKNVIDFGISKILNVDDSKTKGIPQAFDSAINNTKPICNQDLRRPNNFNNRQAQSETYANDSSNLLNLEVSKGQESFISQNDIKNSHKSPINSLNGLIDQKLTPELSSLNDEIGNMSLKQPVSSENSIYKNDKNSSSTSSLESDSSGSLYKKKFSKSFADIFSFGDKKEANSVDASEYVSDNAEGDKPMLLRNYSEESSKSSIFNVFGIFKKKEQTSSSIEDNPRFSRPLKSTIQMPEKERTVIKSAYANKKEVGSFEIPGAKNIKK